MNRQEVYNRVKAHLLTQNKKSMWNSACAYRGEDGMKCAIGCLIKDEFYKPSMEGKGPADTLVLAALNASGVEASRVTQPGNNDSDISFLDNLQVIHDIHKPRYWEVELTSFANFYNLIP